MFRELKDLYARMKAYMGVCCVVVCFSVLLFCLPFL
jgi:hypothetical protein